VRITDAMLQDLVEKRGFSNGTPTYAQSSLS